LGAVCDEAFSCHLLRSNIIAVNPYFQAGRNIGEAPEQDLISDLIIECIKIYGFDLIYLPRQSVNTDDILNEDVLNKYDYGYPIEMYLSSVDGFEGEGSLLSKFGLEIRDTATLVVAKKRWHELVQANGTTQLPTRPTTGDIIYFPDTKAFLEIREVKTKNPFFQVGKLYVYSLSCELMQFSHERFNTNIPEIDETAESFSLDILPFSLLLEEGDGSLLLEDHSDSKLVLNGFSLEDRDKQSQNEQFTRQVKEVLFSKHNPFGDPEGI